MKTWLPPVFLILTAIIGGFIVWWTSGMPSGKTLSLPAVYHRVVMPRPVPLAIPNSPAAPTTTTPTPAPKSPNTGASGFMCPTKFGGFATSTVGPGLYAGLSGEEASAALSNGKRTICLWWADNVTDSLKSYAVYRGFDIPNMPITSMTEIAGVSANEKGYQDSPRSGLVCYIIQIITGKGITYTTNDACFRD